MSVDRTVTQDRTWKAWVGSFAQLERIHSRLKELAVDRQSALLAAIPEPLPGDADDPWELRYEREKQTRARADITDKYKVVARLASPGEAISGTFDEVKQEFDTRTFTRLAFSIDTPLGSDDRVVLRFDPYKKKGGNPPPDLHLDVKSSDRGWALQVMAQVSDEIQRGVPRWSWLYKGWAAGLGTVVLYIAFLVSLRPLLKLIPKTSDTTAELVAAVASIVLALALNWNSRLLYTILPPIEITHDGNQSSASRSIGFLFGVIVVPVAITLIFELT